MINHDDYIDKIISLIPIVLIALAFYIVVHCTGLLFESYEITETLLWLIPLFFAIIFFIMTFSFVLCFKDIKKLFKKIDRKTWIILLVIFIFGLSLRTFVAPHTHRIYYDEDLYLNISQNIARDGRMYVCNYGTQEECFSHDYNKQPNGYAFLISIPFFLFGPSEIAAHYITAVVSSFTTIIVFLITYLMFENKKVAFFSSLIFIFIPIAIIWAPTTSQGTIFMFFSALTIFGFLSYFKNSSNKILLFSFACLAYTIQIRTEGILLIALIALLFIIMDKDLFKKISKANFLIIIVVFSLLITPHLIHTNAIKDSWWGEQEDEEKLGLEHVDNNLHDNVLFFLENTRYPVVFTALSLIGIAFRKYNREKIFLIFWFLAFFGLYLLFYGGSVNFGVDVRFSLSYYVPLAILGGCGSYFIANLINKIIKKQLISVSCISILIIFSFLPFYGFVNSVGIESWSARIPHDFIVENIDDLEEDSMVFTYVPSIVLINGGNAVYSGYITNDEIVKEIFDERENVYYYEEYWTTAPIEPYISVKNYFHDNFILKPINSINESNRGMTRNFTIYSMEMK